MAPVFTATYGDRGKTAIAFAFNADFQRVIQQYMEKFNSMGQTDRISKVPSFDSESNI